MMQPFDMIIFGGTGDLAMRKLLPALYYRNREGDFDPQSRIMGVARQRLSRDEFLAKAELSAKQFIPADQFNAKDWTAFSKLLDYVCVDANTQVDFQGLAANRS